MIEELKGYFQEFLEKRFKQMDLKIQDLQKQILENKREQELRLIDQLDRVFVNQQHLQSQFQSLLKEINVTQKQADEIIEKFSQQVPTTKTQQKYSLPIQSDFQQHLYNLSSSTINLKDQRYNNHSDYSHKPSNIPQQHKGTLQVTNPKVSKFEQGQITVFKTKSGKKYHYSDCDHLQSSKTPITLNEAMKQGLTACKICIN